MPWLQRITTFPFAHRDTSPTDRTTVTDRPATLFIASVKTLVLKFRTMFEFSPRQRSTRRAMSWEVVTTQSVEAPVSPFDFDGEP